MQNHLKDTYLVKHRGGIGKWLSNGGKRCKAEVWAVFLQLRALESFGIQLLTRQVCTEPESLHFNELSVLLVWGSDQVQRT